LKRPFRFYFFSVLILLLGCAPRHIPPPIYGGMDLTLSEVLSEAGRWVDAVKTVVVIDVERDGRPLYHSRASVLIKRPRMAHVRVYNLGMLTVDVVVKGDDVYVLYGRVGEEWRPFIEELYNVVFWWDGVQGGEMYRGDDVYVIRDAGREICIDKETLLPLRQSLQVGGRALYITYQRPEREGDFWYPSFMEIKTDRYRFLVKVEVLRLNPVLGAEEFRAF